MNDIFKIETISQLNEILNQPKAKNPLISVIDFSQIQDFSNSHHSKITSSFYIIMLKSQCHGTLKYGRQYYDFQEGTLVFMAPDQVMAVEEMEDSEIPQEISGWGLFFHPDLIRGTTLANKMKDYSFFSYDTNEALHLSDKEKQTLSAIISQIETELELNIDKHSKTLIASNIELLLNYCTRFYDRQFITRVNSNKDVLSRFETVLNNYFTADLQQEKGLPTVKFCAEQLNLSPNYLSDLLKKETGKNAQDHIHSKVIDTAKNMLLSTNESVSQIAYQLGFEYPQYFSKVFKKKTGQSPAAYRNMA